MSEKPKFFDLVKEVKAQTPNAQALRDHVNQSDNALDILVHPFHHKFYRTMEGEEVLPDPLESDRYVDLRDRFISAQFEQGRPIVIFDRFNDIESGRLRNRLSGNEGVVFTVKTQRTNGHPNAGNWDESTEAMKDLGVKRANLSGEYFSLIHKSKLDKANIGWETHNPEEAIEIISGFLSELNPNPEVSFSNLIDWVNQGLFPIGCVSHVAIGLISKGINVRVSPVTCQLPEEYLNLGLKKTDLFAPLEAIRG